MGKTTTLIAVPGGFQQFYEGGVSPIAMRFPLASAVCRNRGTGVRIPVAVLGETPASRGFLSSASVAGERANAGLQPDCNPDAPHPQPSSPHRLGRLLSWLVTALLLLAVLAGPALRAPSVP